MAETRRELNFESFDSQETLELPGLDSTELDSDETRSPIPRDDQSFETTPTPTKDPSKDQVDGIPEIPKDNIEIEEKVDGIPEIPKDNIEIEEKVDGIPEIAKKDTARPGKKKNKTRRKLMKTKFEKVKMATRDSKENTRNKRKPITRSRAPVSPETKRQRHRAASKRWHDKWICRGVPKDDKIDKDTKMTAAKSKAKPTKRVKETVLPANSSCPERKMPKETRHIFYLFSGGSEK